MEKDAWSLYKYPRYKKYVLFITVINLPLGSLSKHNDNGIENGTIKRFN